MKRKQQQKQKANSRKTNKTREGAMKMLISYDDQPQQHCATQAKLSMAHRPRMRAVYREKAEKKKK